MSSAALKLPTSRLIVTPVQPTIGAEVEGVDFREPLDDATRDEILALLYKHKVLFFRDQELTQEQHIALGRRFGELEFHPTSPADRPEILRIASHDPKVKSSIENYNAEWHADTTFRPEPAAISILRGIQVPSIGGDTLWADAVAAYNGLPEEVKERIKDLKAVHSIVKGFGRYIKDENNRSDLERYRAKHPEVEHPVVRTHPVTGEKILFVNLVFTSHIVGLPEAESEKLLTYLYDQFKRPEYQVRLKWRPNTIAFWDNRATQHYGVYNHNEPRVVERVTIAGERPF